VPNGVEQEEAPATRCAGHLQKKKKLRGEKRKEGGKKWGFKSRTNIPARQKSDVYKHIRKKDYREQQTLKRPGPYRPVDKADFRERRMETKET